MDVKYHIDGIILDDGKRVCPEVVEFFLICRVVLIVAFDCLATILVERH